MPPPPKYLHRRVTKKMPRSSDQRNNEQSKDFAIWRERWCKQVLKDRNLAPRFKLVALVMALFYFNRLKRTAWPSQRKLAEEAGISRTQVQLAIAALEEYGHLVKKPAQINRMGKPHYIYTPTFKAAKTGARVAPTSRPDSLNDSLIQIATLSAPADAGGRRESKRTFDEGKEDFTLDDVSWVQDLLLADFGYDCPVTVQKIVAMCREPGANEYPIDGRQIALMAQAGYLGRRGNHIWIDRTCRMVAAA
jgi:hypothetical protein